MVHTRQEAKADSSPARDERLVETGDRGLEGDPLVDMTSFVPAVSMQSGQGESSGLRDERGVFDGDGQGTQPPPTVAPTSSTPYGSTSTIPRSSLFCAVGSCSDDRDVGTIEYYSQGYCGQFSSMGKKFKGIRL